MKVTVNPCQIMSFEPSEGPTSFTYEVGSGEMIIKEGVFQQLNNCGYQRTTVTSGLLQFMNYDETSDVIKIETDEPSHADSYLVTIDSEIQVPDDHTMSSFTTWTASFVFNVAVELPCTASEINPFTLSTMQV